MSKQYNPEELNQLSGSDKDQIILAMQEQIKTLNENYEKVLEMFRIATANKYGRSMRLRSFPMILLSLRLSRLYRPTSVRSRKVNVMLIWKASRWRLFLRIPYPRKNWILSLARATGRLCLQRNISAFVMSRLPGQ